MANRHDDKLQPMRVPEETAERFQLWQRTHHGAWPNRSTDACSLGIPLQKVRAFETTVQSYSALGLTG